MTRLRWIWIFFEVSMLRVGIMALGEIGAQYEGIAPNDPRLEAIFALAEELDIPVSIHVGLTKPGGVYDDYPKYRAALGDPMLLEEVLIRHPKLRINVMG